MNGDRGQVNTERLCLRRFDSEDLDAYAKIMGDREVGKWFAKGDGYTWEESRKSLDDILNHWTRYGFGIWAVLKKEEQALLGRCGLNVIPQTSEVEVDFALARAWWGRGYATEAAKAAVAYGFDVLNLDKIIALSRPENGASRRVIEKIGFKYIKNAQYWGIVCVYYEISKANYQRSQL